MTKQSIEELPSATKRLLRMERRAAGPPAMVAERLRTRISCTIAGGVASETRRATPVGAKLGALLVGLIVAGGAAALLASRLGGSAAVPAQVQRIVRMEGAPERTAATPSPSASHSSSSTLLMSRSTPPRRPLRAAGSAAGRRVSAATEVLAEADVLESGRRSLEAGDIEDALDAVATHEKRWRSGVLTPEREVLAINALAARGDSQQARERATRFLARFPDSTLAPRVRALVGQAAER